jgi:hypothetical protein
MPEKTYDLIILGGGSGGVGTAIAATRAGVKTLLVEAQPWLGGNSTSGGVNTWEMGVRETWRTVCEKTLTENDINTGLSNQTDTDLIAIADHPLDRHGVKGGCPEVREPYGIPYRCLIPKGKRNLLIACRGAGFSSIAASSCRLSRTMMQLGQAAGTAVALAMETRCALPEVSASTLRNRLREQHVQLDWPIPMDLRNYLEDRELQIDQLPHPRN